MLDNSEKLISREKVLGSVDGKPSFTEKQRITKIDSVQSFKIENTFLQANQWSLVKEIKCTLERSSEGSYDPGPALGSLATRTMRRDGCPPGSKFSTG